MAKYRTLDEFLVSGFPNSEYIRYKTIVAYMRKGRRAVDGQIFNALTIANIKNTRRASNVEINPRHKRTGLFSEFEGLVRKAAVERGYDGVYVECVFNPFLPEVLIRYGYKRVNVYNSDVLCGNDFWIKV